MEHLGTDVRPDAVPREQLEDTSDRKLALPGQLPFEPGFVHQVGGRERRAVDELHGEDLVGRDGPQSAFAPAAADEVPDIENEPGIVASDKLDDSSRGIEIGNCAERQRLQCDAQAARSSGVAEHREPFGGELDGKRGGAQVRRNDRIGAEFRGCIEKLGAGPAEPEGAAGSAGSQPP